MSSSSSLCPHMSSSSLCPHMSSSSLFPHMSSSSLCPHMSSSSSLCPHMSSSSSLCPHMSSSSSLCPHISSSSSLCPHMSSSSSLCPHMSSSSSLCPHMSSSSSLCPHMSSSSSVSSSSLYPHMSSSSLCPHMSSSSSLCPHMSSSSSLCPHMSSSSLCPHMSSSSSLCPHMSSSSSLCPHMSSSSSLCPHMSSSSSLYPHMSSSSLCPHMSSSSSLCPHMSSSSSLCPHMSSSSLEGKDEIAFDKGVVVEVIQKNLEGWWFIRHQDKEGWAPASYLKKVKEEFSSQRKKSTASPVEIIGNIMEISNLLNNKKEVDGPLVAQPEDGPLVAQHEDGPLVGPPEDGPLVGPPEDGPLVGQPEDGPLVARRQISLLLPCTERGTNVTAACPTTPPPLQDAKSKTASPTHPASPASPTHPASPASPTHLASPASSTHPASPASPTHPASPAVARIAPHRVEIGSPVLRQKPPPRRDTTLGFQLPCPPEPPTVEAEYYTIAEFQSCISDGISFNGGQKAEVIEKNSGGWWYVQIGEREGWAPCSYIDKRKKPNLNRRTSTLTRPKVPPPAPPVKKQDSAETPSSPGSEGPESPVWAGQPVYEEPEYDVPAIGDLDMESEFEFLRAGGSLVDCEDQNPSSSDKPDLGSSLARSFQDRNGGECIYENEGFRPFLPEAPKGPTSVVAVETVRSASSLTTPGNELKIHLNHKAQESPTTPKSTSSESTPDLTRRAGPPRDREVGGKTGSSSGKSACKPKPVVRPKPQLTKASGADKVDTLRRRPAGQPRSCGEASKGEDSETASVVSSSDSSSSRSTSDLSSTPSKGSRGGDFDPESVPRAGMYRATDSYEKVRDAEISFPAGAEVEAVEKQEGGWWYVRWGEVEGWAPAYFLEPVDSPDDAAGSETDSGPSSSVPETPGSLRKSDSLEKNERRVRALNNLNQINLKRATPPVPAKPPGGLGFFKPPGGSKPAGFFAGFSAFKHQSAGGGGGGAKRQQVVRPQSVYISAPMALVPGSPRLRRNESLGAADPPRSSGPPLRRHASFGPTPTDSPDSAARVATSHGDFQGRRSGSAFSPDAPVSTVTPKPNVDRLYVSIADYHGDEETMGFPEGTSLEVLERNPNGWWYCKVLDSGRPRKGWVPSNYLEVKH
ncbi:hypothetical protein NHX12_022982 [Muraenolepis orangiensis]|uniref:SH3 domain-containing protein n=1 Tax=Muraenolepis orangiensis TaxID=630683 RepID=A0A9Q0EUI0_9TELE|nr:hypothetical protein NHX12_022982 [Muraenolepis orangiensis]